MKTKKKSAESKILKKLKAELKQVNAENTKLRELAHNHLISTQEAIKQARPYDAPLPLPDSSIWAALGTVPASMEAADRATWREEATKEGVKENIMDPIPKKSWWKKLF